MVQQDMGTTDIHPAEAYLRNTANPPSLYVKIYGKRRRLFINRDENVIGIVAPGKRKSGYYFSDWQSLEKIYYPTTEDDTDKERQPTRKSPCMKTISRQGQRLTGCASGCQR